jgi:molybdopterin/thiamine biosynthesis adenylyltransferase
MSDGIELLIKNLDKTIQELSLSKPLVIDKPFNDSSIKCVKLSLPPSYSLYLLPSDLFPLAPPVALMDWGNGNNGTQLPLDWECNNNVGVSVKLFDAISKYIFGKPPYSIVYGENANNPLTSNQEIASSFSWKKLLVTSSVNIPSLTKSLTDRIELGLVKAMATSSVTLVGLGSVGSYMAEQLIRTGLESITLIDPDIVEASNVSRTVYTLHDLNRNKTDALNLRLKQINPNALVECYSSSLQDIGGNVLKEIFEESDIIIAATDDPQAQSLINLCAFYSKVPAVFIGLYKGAMGGEVAITIPTMTPCLQCMTGLRRSVDYGQNSVSRSTDYGTNRLTGEIALNSDIQHVSSAALKICYSLIASLKGAESTISNFVPNAIAQEKHFLTLGMEPDYWFYPDVFKDSAGQYAFQSVWLTASHSDDCHICGHQSVNMENPYKHIVPTPNPANIRDQIQL